ncbi:MAG: HAD family hydrolase, partial [Faecalibacterium sp.]|nr:HAD family hydrolase [Faecalibacterium sp.]
ITSNGAAVWDLGSDPLGAVYSRYANAAERQTSEPTCLLRRLMPVETARAAFDLFMEYPGSMGVFWNGYSVKDQASVDFAAARWARLHSTEARQPNDGRFLVVRDLGEWMSRHAHEVEKQCLFFAEQDQVPQALARFRAMPGVEVVQGSPENIEVTAAGVDKGEALLTLADRLGIPRAQTLAVGDSENDRAMLEKAGVAAVMANGMPQIKALADLVTTADCDHDGVAEVFETLGL